MDAPLEKAIEIAGVPEGLRRSNFTDGWCYLNRQIKNEIAHDLLAMHMMRRLQKNVKDKGGAVVIKLYASAKPAIKIEDWDCNVTLKVRGDTLLDALAKATVEAEKMK